MNETPKPKRKWIPILIGVLLLFVILGVGGIAFITYWAAQNVSIAEANTASGAASFDTVLAKYPGQMPLIQMREGRPHYDADRAAAPNAAPISRVHVMAFDENEGKLVTGSLPMWLLRMKSGPIRFGAYAQGLDDRGITFQMEDLEKHGPGIILDVRDKEGRVLIWAE